MLMIKKIVRGLKIYFERMRDVLCGKIKYIRKQKHKGDLQCLSI